MLKGNFIAINTYIRKGESFQINDLSFYCKKEQEKIIHKVGVRKEMMKIRA